MNKDEILELMAIEIAKELFIQDIKRNNMNIDLHQQIGDCLCIGDEFISLASKWFTKK